MSPSTSRATWVADHGEPANGLPIEGGDRYRLQGELGSGRMGVVYRARDLHLERDVALKVLKSEATARMHDRFVREARATAKLQHPNIVPVYDAGFLPDGRVYYTMRIADGERLALTLPPAGDPARPVALRRLVSRLRDVAEALDHAHAHGIIHRDLKPENLMIDERGQVLVVDWGLARVDIAPDPDGLASPMGSRVSTDGTVKGTPAFMAPEQAQGLSDRVGPPVDVFALGVVLFEALAQQKLRDDEHVDRVLARACQPVPHERWSELADAPRELVALCQRMLRHTPAARPPAGEVAQELANWLDGVAALARADRWVEEARALDGEAARLQARAQARDDEARALEPTIPKAAPIDEKRPLWRLGELVADLRREAGVLEQRRLIALHRAISLVPTHGPARAELAAHHRARHESAERRRDFVAAARAEAQLREHDDGRHRAYLDGLGRLELTVDPPDAMARISRFEESDRRLVLVHRLTRRCPVRLTLPHGSWLVLLDAPGRATVRYPVAVPRDGRWPVAPPGSDRHVLVMPSRAQVGEDDVFVAGGWTAIGGDARAPSADRPASRIWVDDFVIRRHPVTNGEYLAWLNRLVAAGRADEAEARVPRSGSEPLYARADDGTWSLTVDAQGHRWVPRQPVVCISWDDAMAFAAAHAAETGQPWRLPTELEWEKAARGVDGRFLPWGFHADANWAWCRYAWSEGGAPRPVDAHATDESPYGVRGLAGNVQDWCLDPWSAAGPEVEGERAVVPDARPERPAGVTKGGAWSSGLLTQRAAARFMLERRFGRPSIGFRLARPVDARAD